MAPVYLSPAEGPKMSTNHEFYRARAAEARADADAATLDNVRDRCLRSEAAWTEMADRVQRGEKMREKLLAEKSRAGTVVQERV